MIYNDISLDLTLKQFQDINNDLKKYDFTSLINIMKIVL